MTVTYAGRLERLFAYLIDQLGAILAAMVSTILFTALGFLKIGGTPEQPQMGGSAYIVVFLSLTAYHVITTASSWQCTPGQRIMGIRIARTDGRALTTSSALERFLAYIIPSLPIYASFLPEKLAPALVVCLNMLWFLPILTTPQRTGIHDRLCNTRVIVGRTK